jgi:hypothetical protein
MIDWDRLAAELRARHPEIAAQIPQLDDVDELKELVDEEREDVLTLSWEPEHWGHAGAHYVDQWRGFYFLHSSDIDAEGPFPSLAAVLSDDHFHIETPNPELSSSELRTSALMGLALDLVADGEEITVNKQRFRRAGKLLVAVDQGA